MVFRKKRGKKEEVKEEETEEKNGARTSNKPRHKSHLSIQTSPHLSSSLTKTYFFSSRG